MCSAERSKAENLGHNSFSAVHGLGNIASGHVEITFPNGKMLRCDNPQANAELSALVGYDSVLQPLRPAADDNFYRRYKTDEHTWLEELKATFAREEGEPLPDLDNLPQSMQDFVSVPGTFFWCRLFIF